MKAPLSFTEAVMNQAERSDVKLTLREDCKPKGSFPRILFLDERYVIADDFRVELVE